MQTNTELFLRAASDSRLSHGAVRTLILKTLPEQRLNGPQIAKRIGAMSTKTFCAELCRFGYLPPQPGYGFCAKK
jgi:hypothetical protein